jgi:hypothetical protein
MQINKQRVNIPPDVMARAKALAEELRTLLEPYVYALTPTERHDLPKMGDKTFSFVKKAFEFSKENPEFCPPFLDRDEFAIEFTDAHDIGPLYVMLLQSVENLDDTRILAGSAAYRCALAFYNSVRQAAAQDVPGAKAVYEALKIRFPRVKHNQEDKEILE